MHPHGDHELPPYVPKASTVPTGPVGSGGSLRPGSQRPAAASRLRAGGGGSGANPPSASPLPPIVIPGYGPLPPIPPHALRFVRKFGPLILIVTLLFAVKYLLISIHLNVRRMKADVSEQCRSLQSDLNVTAWGHVERVKNENWKQHRMVGRGTYGFVQWSAYRVQEGRVVGVGFGATLLRDHRKVTSCTWHGADGVTIMGDPKILYPRDEPHEQYETVIVRCILHGQVVTNLGGYLVVGIDNEQVILYREDRDSPTHALLAATHPYRLSLCAFPITDPVDGARMAEWMHVHRSMGVDHVIGYDAGGIDRTALKEIKLFLDERFLELLPMRDVTHFKLQNHGKLMAMHDCLYRSVLTSSWVIFLDWDDTLALLSPPSLPELLLEHRSAPWLTFGCRVWGTKLCMDATGAASAGAAAAAAGGAMPQERMVFHWPHYLCMEGDPPMENSLCLGARGHRYVIANTAKVTLLGENEVVEPLIGGVDLSADNVRHERFESLHKRGASADWCKEVYSDRDKVEWWAKSTDLKDRLEGIRKKVYATSL